MKRALLEMLGETEHERCPDGTHWHDEQGKCVKIPDHVVSMQKLAKDAESAAYAKGDRAHGEWAGSPKKKSLHSVAADAYSRASNAHSLAAKRAQKHGFSGLAGEHSHKSQELAAKASDHKSRSR